MASTGIATTTHREGAVDLSDFLRDRRARVRPAAVDACARRRTPGLRREEVATRADVSVTWYTFLEQGRGGTPSSDVLERLARALELAPGDREVLFLLAQRRPAPFDPARATDVAPSLQRVIDAMPTSPAVIKNITWDALAWNTAMVAVLRDYGALPPDDRNMLRHVFMLSREHRSTPAWEAFASFVLAAFRADMARAGDCPRGAALVDELHATSEDFRRMWQENKVLSQWGGRKSFDHPLAGPLTVDYATFAIDGTSGLSMVLYTPGSDADTRAIERLVAARLASVEESRSSPTGRAIVD